MNLVVKRWYSSLHRVLFLGLIAACAPASLLQAQLAHHTWLFGNSTVGIRFNFTTNVPARYNVSATPMGFGGSATVNDPVSGNLLFYSDGERVYNSGHTLVASGLGGDSLGAQAASVSAVPCECDQFYIFSNSAGLSGGVPSPGILRSSIVDLRNGTVTVPVVSRAQTVLDSIGEGLELIPHPNTRDYWIVGRKSLSTLFFVIPVTCAGIGSPTYYDFAASGALVNDYVFNLRYSAVAGKIAGAYQAGPVVTLDFNANTGVLSNYTGIGNGGLFTYDCEWSPDGSKLYYCRSQGVAVSQYNYSTVPPTTTLLYSTGGTGGGLRLGPDGAIYHIPNVFGSTLNRITTPNNPGIGSNYQINAFNTGAAITGTKFPTTFGVPLINRVGSLSADSLCAGTSVQLADTGGVSYLWTPATHLSCDTCSNPVASPDSSITYTVTVTFSNGCSIEDTFALTVFPFPPAEAGPDTVVCGGQAISLIASGGISYLWSPAAGLSATNTANPLANPVVSTRYFVTVTDTNACQATDSVFVRVFSVNAGADSTICQGDTVPLSSSPGGVAYSWSPAAGLSAANISNPLAFPDSTTDYIVSVTDSSGCIVSDTLRITVNPLPVLRITVSAPYVCAGSSIQLFASGGLTYVWRPDTTLSNLFISNPRANPVFQPPGPVDTAWYYVSTTDANGCASFDSIAVPIRLVPAITVSPDTFACPGDSVALLASGGASYLWSPAAGLDDPALPNPLAFPDTTTLYTVVVTDTFGCSNTGMVQVYTLTPVLGPDIQVCRGDTGMIYASGGVSYVWSPAFGLSQPNSDSTLAYPDTSTYYVVTVTDSLGCVATDSVLVLVNALPTAIADPDTVICAGDSLTLRASGGVSYTWDPDTTLSNLSIPNPVASPDSSQAYYVTVTDLNGCQARDSARVGVSPPPPADAGPDLTKCGHVGVQLLASGGATYQWTPADSLSDPGIANPIANPSDTTTYYVTVTDFLGCSALDSVTVSTMYASISPDDTLCQGDSVQLLASGGISYLWTPLAGISDPSRADPMAAPDSSTRYQVVVGDPSGCSDTAFVTLTVLPAPAADAGPDTALCAGQSVTLMASGGGSYLWDADTTLAGIATATPVATPIDTTVYYVTVTDSNGCQARDSVTVSVWPLPLANAGPDSALCEGDTLQLLASGGGTYSWQPRASLSDSTLADPLAFPTVTTIYVLVVTDSNGCENQDLVRITVDPLPTISPPLQDTLLHCQGDTSGRELAMGLVADTNYTYVWQPSFGVSDSTLANPVLHLPDTIAVGFYPYILTVTNRAGCSVSDTVVIDVQAGSQVPLGGPVSACPGMTYTYYVVNANATGYLWQVINGTGVPNANGDSIRVTWNPLADSGVVFVAGGAAPCDGGALEVLLTRPEIVADTTIDPRCAGSADGSITVVVQGGSLPLQYQWTPGGSGGPQLSSLTAGTYSLAITDAAGCATNGSYSLSEPPPLVVTLLDTGGTSCGLSNGYASVIASGGTSPYQYLWSTNPPQTSSRADNLASGSYTVQVTDAQGCMESLAVTINERPLQRASFTTDPDSGLVLCMPKQTTVQFVNTSENASSYYWYFGDGQTSTEVNPEHTYQEEGLYTVILIAFDASGACPSMDTLVLEVLPASRLFLPNAFTPNSDGYNDVFFVKGVQIVEMEMNIFDRWGGLVATLTQLEEGWDGRLKNGASAPEGVYAYVLRATFKNGQRIERGGTITLFR